MKTAVVLTIVGALVLIGIFAFALDASVDHGKEVYATQKCALCHSIGGIGGKKLALDGVGSRLKPEDMKKWIRTPKEMKPDTTMKPYPNLPERDLNDLTAFLVTLR
jgi:cytochrome c2